MMYLIVWEIWHTLKLNYIWQDKLANLMLLNGSYIIDNDSITSVNHLFST